MYSISSYIHTRSGKAQFVNSAYQAFENNGSVEVCVQAEGYGFTVNVSAGIYILACGFSLIMHALWSIMLYTHKYTVEPIK